MGKETVAQLQETENLRQDKHKEEDDETHSNQIEKISKTKKKY